VETLYEHLRRKGKKYGKRGNSFAGRGHIPNRVDIEERLSRVEWKRIRETSGNSEAIGKFFLFL